MVKRYGEIEGILDECNYDESDEDIYFEIEKWVEKNIKFTPPKVEYIGEKIK